MTAKQTAVALWIALSGVVAVATLARAEPSEADAEADKASAVDERPQRDSSRAIELDEPFVDPTAGIGEPAEAPATGPTTGTPVEGEVPPAWFDTRALELRLGGKLQTDLRFRIQGKSVGPTYDHADRSFYTRDDLPAGVARNENICKLELEAVSGRFAGVVDIDFVWLGYPGEIASVSELSLRDRLDPYYLETHALYLEASDLLVDGLDLRVGQQLVQWGKGDQFNPTNNLNPNDLEDVLLFGQQRANAMLRVDYNPLGSLVLSAVLVPVFKPALTPRTAPLALAATDRLPFSPQGLRQRILVEKAYTELVGWPTVISQVKPEMPDRSLDNMQFALRVAGTLLGQDVALSYYRGRHDFPQPVANHSEQLATPLCSRSDPDECIEGLLQTEVRLVYPRTQVLGLNLAGEIPLDWIARSLRGIGYRLELGVYLPERTRIRLTQGEITIGLMTQPASEYDYDLDGEPGGPRPVVVDATPFAKWTFGLDYTFAGQVMLNVMWVHGMVDEFGAGDFLHPGWTARQAGVRLVNPDDQSDLIGCVIQDRILGTDTCGARYAREVQRPRLGDYAVLGLDIRFADDQALLRLFAIWDLSGYFEDRYDEQRGGRVRRYLSLFGDGLSAILYPELNYNFGHGLELSCGALLQFGKWYTKFGDPAAGGHLIWTRARYSF